MKRYNPKELEPKWQKKWMNDKRYAAVDFDQKRPKYVMLTEFPYPSGDGLHLGHTREYTLGDIIARYKRQTGHNVLYPMGYDAFGLPTENYAIKNKISPEVATKNNTDNFYKQFQSLGFSFDWDRFINTTDPSYYKWTQWLFLQFYKAGLAYQAEVDINWCPKCKTGLANEEVVNSRHERCDTLVEKKTLKQWMLKITEYADRLIEGLKDVDYPSRIADQQVNWIGRSKGAEIDFALDRPFCRTFIMGEKNITKVDIEGLGGRIVRVTEAGYLCVEFPRSSKRLFEELIVEKMEPGFWNEYLGDEIVFIFKHKDGKTERYVLSDDTHDAIRKLGAAFNSQDDDPQVRVHDWLANNEWYKDWFSAGKLQSPDSLRVFTTRPDTLFGATFLVLAPEHVLVETITSDEQRAAVHSYIKAAQAKSEIERQDTSREKTGVFTGAYAINPVNNEKIPVWIADYVLTGYGTGAIMAVPAHDERDFAFAQKFEIPVKQVIAPEYVDLVTPTRKGVKFVEREVAQLIIKHPTDDKYLLLKRVSWDTPSYSFVVGGRDKGETFADAAVRELLEEAGYKNPGEVIELGHSFYTQFYHEHKKLNRRAYLHNFYTQLKDLEQDPVSEEESQINQAVWVDSDEVIDLVHGEGPKEVFRQLTDGPCAYGGKGILINSGKYDGMNSSEAREKIVADLEKADKGKERINYRLRDWIFSRQHYWGEPIPVIHCEKDGAVAVPDDQLPVELPPVEHYEPTDTGESPLAAIPEWVNTTCPKCGAKAKRETDTMPNWAGSSWYYLRYYDPHNDKAFADKKKLEYWGMADLYLGGMEHTTLHLLYSRFWHQFFYDQGLVPTPEPYAARRGQGIILAADGSKMSKSKGNVINPSSVIDDGYGADAVRLAIAFLAPYDQTTPWNPEGVAGTFRFLQRIWTLTHEYLLSKSDTDEDQKDVRVAVHKAIKKVSDDLHSMSFNTAIAALMEATNELYKIKADKGFVDKDAWQFALVSILQLLAPFAPHITEELWQDLGKKDSIHVSEWPVHDEKYLQSDTIKIVVQVNGKVRAMIDVSADLAEEKITKLAQSDDNVKQHIDGKDIKKTIFVPNRLVNFVV